MKMKQHPTLPELFFAAQKLREGIIPSLAEYFGCDVYELGFPTQDTLKYETCPFFTFDLSIVSLFNADL